MHRCSSGGVNVMQAMEGQDDDARDKAKMKSEFSVGSYMVDRRAQIVVGIVCLIVVAGMLSVLGIVIDAVVVVSGVIALGFVVMLAIGYVRRRRFYVEIEELACHLERASQLPALIEEPEFLEGRLTYRVLEISARLAADEAMRYKDQANSYRDYIELWIHEIKTPITAANLMIADLHGPVVTKLKGELDRIEVQVEQALYYARSTSLARDYAIREVALPIIVRDVCKKNARYLIEQGTTPVIELPENATVFADPLWLAFVIGQVAVNAAKYDAVHIRFTIRVEEEASNVKRTVLEIADDGCGIPDADVPRVFDRGFTGENGRMRRSSTGMGLYLAATMCEKMGLGIAIASEVGTGTRVMIVFPHDRRRLDVQG